MGSAAQTIQDLSSLEDIFERLGSAWTLDEELPTMARALHPRSCLELGDDDAARREHEG